MIVEGDVEGVGKVKMPGLVPKLSETPGRTEWYGGRLGAHNEEVYGGGAHGGGTCGKVAVPQVPSPFKPARSRLPACS